MPTYQYACTECGEQLEAVQKFTDDPLTVCSACGGKLRKRFSAVGIVFKGSGFYRTDSRNGSSGSTGGKKPEPATASGDSGGKSEPAAKPAGTGSPKKAETASTGSSSSSSPSSGTKVA